MRPMFTPPVWDECGAIRPPWLRIRVVLPSLYRCLSRVDLQAAGGRIEPAEHHVVTSLLESIVQGICQQQPTIGRF